MFLLLLISPALPAQKQFNIDSLKRVSKTAKDTMLVKTYVLLSDMYLRNSPDTGLYYSHLARELSEKVGYRKGLGDSYDNIAIINAIQANYPVAKEYFLKSLAIKTELKDKKGTGGIYLNLAGICRQAGDYPEALDYQFKSLKIFEDLKDVPGIGRNYSNIGILYRRMKNDSLALEYYFKSLKIHEQLGLKGPISSNCNNIATVYVDQKKYSLALEYMIRSLKLKKELNDIPGQGQGYANIGVLYLDMGNDELALKYLKDGLQIMLQLNDRPGITAAYVGLGNCYTAQKNYREAISNFQKAVEMAAEAGLKDELSQAYQHLAMAYEKNRDYKNAYKYHTLYSDLKDSVLNKENSKQIAEMAAKYETDKKELKINALNKDKDLLVKDQKLKETQLNKQQIVNYAVISGLVLVLALAFFIYKGYRQKQSANQLLEEKNTLIEEKNKDIIDSINYARRIQFTLLAQKETLQKNLGDHFLLLQPKDIVSGDFYWASRQGNRFYFAVCDSTGHGVPGAFMSLLNISFLNEAVSEKNLKQPSEILDYVRQRLIENISQDGAQDGMDGILVCFEGDTISYSAANNPPLLIRNNELQVLPCDKMPVGKGEKQHPFTLHTIERQKGDTLYLLTDGYTDQFGGPEGKKFKHKRLAELLVRICPAQFDLQLQTLQSTINDWKGDMEQVDDILVVGIRL